MAWLLLVSQLLNSAVFTVFILEHAQNSGWTKMNWYTLYKSMNVWINVTVTCCCLVFLTSRKYINYILNVLLMVIVFFLEVEELITWPLKWKWAYYVSHCSHCMLATTASTCATLSPFNLYFDKLDCNRVLWHHWWSVALCSCNHQRTPLTLFATVNSSNNSMQMVLSYCM